MVVTYSRVWIDRVRLTILLVVSWTRKMNISLSPLAPESLIFREMGLAVPSRASLLILYSQAEYGAYSRDSSRFPRRRPLTIGLNRHTPSSNRLAQLRTDGVDCRESAGTGPVNLKVVPATAAAFSGHHEPINVRLSFSTLTIIGMKWL